MKEQHIVKLFIIISCLVIAPFVEAQVSAGAVRFDATVEAETSVQTGVVSPRDAQSGQSNGKTVDLDASATVNAVVAPRESGTGKATGRTATGTGATTGLPEQASATATLRARVGAYDPIVLDRDRSGSKRGTTSVRVMLVSSTSISTEADLRALAEQALADDPRVKLIKLQPDLTEIDYEYRGRLFGVIPVKPVLKATADADGNVKVKFPWYEIFVNRSGAVEESDLSATVEAEVSASINADPISVQARIFQTISNIMKSKHDTAKNSVGNIR